VLASSIGGGVHFLNEETYGRFSIPNFKIGAMVNPKLGILLYVPGGTYKQKGEDRAFEGFFPTVQYWVTDKFYVNAGIGLAVETTPFYKVDYSQGPPKFNTGFGYTVSTGKEIIQWSTNKTVDIQIRLLYGNITYQDKSKMDNLAIDFLVGINLY
jgi:hypothetical protein